MGLTDAHLHTHIKLEGFTSYLVAGKGVIELAVTIREGQIAKTTNVEFMVMDLKSSYGMILGIPAQCSFGVIASIPHQCIKYYTDNETGVIRCNPSIRLNKRYPELIGEVSHTNNNGHLNFEI